MLHFASATGTPRMIPPVTVTSVCSELLDQTSTSQRSHCAGEELIPAWRLQTTSSGHVENANASSSGKPKRHSRQRQKAAGAKGAYVEASNVEYQGRVELDEQTRMQQPLTGALPAATSYGTILVDCTSLGMSEMPYQMLGRLGKYCKYMCLTV